MNKYRICTIIFILFAFIGLTGHVWGVGTSTPTLPENMNPKEKNLYNYIMSKANCDSGEAILVLQMLVDQLSENEYSAFILYMMDPNAPANFPGMDPNYTLDYYFTHDDQCMSMKERFDGDMVDYGRMNHQEKMNYIKHTGNDVFALLEDLGNSNDHNKLNYVLNRGFDDNFNDAINRLADQMDKDNKAGNPVKMKNAAYDIKHLFENQGNTIADAITTYDYLFSMHQAPKIEPNVGNDKNELNNAINTLDHANKKLINTLVTLTTIWVVVGLAIWVICMADVATLEL